MLIIDQRNDRGGNELGSDSHACLRVKRSQLLETTPDGARVLAVLVYHETMIVF